MKERVSAAVPTGAGERLRASPCAASAMRRACPMPIRVPIAIFYSRHPPDWGKARSPPMRETGLALWRLGAQAPAGSVSR
ncbi:hypothetical protein GCM10023166_18120 [Paeniglutamicibacter cryotolerans]